MSKADPTRHLVVLRDAQTGKHLHIPFEDVAAGLSQVEASPAVVAPDPRIEAIQTEVASIQNALPRLAQPAIDPRIDDLAQRLARLEAALGRLIDRALADREPA